MNKSYNNINDYSNLIKNELKGLYDDNEINSFIKIIFENLFNYSSMEILLNQDTKITPNSYFQIINIIERLKIFEPIQYIFKKTVFYGMEFILNNKVLIPRPETEELVNWIIIDNKRKGLKILDIGTGSGNIALSLSKYLENTIVEAIDKSKAAIYLANKNAKILGEKVKFRCLDILKKRHQRKLSKYDIIVSNPPYVTESEKKNLSKNVLEYEPADALFVEDKEPFIFYKVISEFAKAHLNEGGLLYFEINENYGTNTLNTIWKAGFTEIIMKKDLNGKERMIKAIV